MALQGKGFFIWKIKNCEGGDAALIAKKAKKAGLSHVLIKVANGIYSYNYDWARKIDLVPPVAEALRSADRYKGLCAAGVQEIRYFPDRASFRQPQTGCR